MLVNLCGGRWASILLIGGGMLLGVSFSSCRARPAGEAFDCACELLTDTDELSSVRATVCATAMDEARVLAKSCAQSGAPATVQACRCARSESHPVCKARGCQKVHERR